MMNDLSKLLTSESNFNFNNIKHLPNEILKEIQEYLIDSIIFISIKKLKEQGLNLLNYYFAFKEFIFIKNTINSLKEKHRLIFKYSAYNEGYINRTMSKPSEKAKKQSSHPILLDILFSGCYLPYADSTFDEFTKIQEDDLKLCLKLFPNSIYSNFGQLRCRYSITPLQAACFNECIPINIIELIIQKDKSLIHEPILFNGFRTNLLDDLEDNNNIQRVDKIKELFKKYST